MSSLERMEEEEEKGGMPEKEREEIETGKKGFPWEWFFEFGFFHDRIKKSEIEK